MLLKSNSISIERSRIIFTTLPKFMDLESEKDECTKFIHYLQYGFSKIEIIDNAMYVDIFDLRDRMPSKQFLNWFGWYQTHVHRHSIREDTMAELYYIGTDPSGILIEYVEKITDMYPIMDSTRLCHMRPEDIVTLESGNIPLVNLRLGFHIARHRSTAITNEAYDLLQQNNIKVSGMKAVVDTVGFRPMLWDDNTLTGLGQLNWKASSNLSLNPELGASKIHIEEKD